MMTPRLWFGIGVRLLGLWELLYGMDEVIMMFGISQGTYHSGLYSSPGGLFPFAVFHLVVGVLLLKGASFLVVWCYPSREVAANEPNQSESV